MPRNAYPVLVRWLTRNAREPGPSPMAKRRGVERTACALLLGLVLTTCGGKGSSAAEIGGATRSTRGSEAPPTRSFPILRRGGSEPVARAEVVFQRVHRRDIVDLAMAPTGRTLAAISADGAVGVYDARDGSVRATIRPFIGTSRERRLDFDRSGTRLLINGARTAREAGGFILWDLHTGILARPDRLGAWKGTRGATLHPGGERIAWIESEPGRDAGGRLHLARAEDATDLRVAALSPQEARALHFDPRGGRLVLVGTDRTRLFVRDGESLSLISVIEARHPGDEPRSKGRFSEAIAFSPDSRSAIALQHDGIGILFDLFDGHVREIFHIPESAPFAPPMATFSPDGQIFAVATENEITVRDASSAHEVASITHDGRGGPGLGGFDARGRQLFVQSAGLVRRFDARSGDELAQIDLGAAFEDPRAVATVQVSPDGRRVVAGATSGLAMVDLETSRLVFAIPPTGGEPSVWGVRFRPDERGILTWGRSMVDIWSAERGIEATSCRGAGDPVWEAAGAHLYLQSHSLCELETGRRHRLRGIVGVSGDRSVYAAGSRTAGLHTFDLASREVRAGLGVGGELPCSEWGSCRFRAHFDHGGETVGVHLRGALHFFDASTGRRLGRRRAPPDAHVALAPDGRSYVISSGNALTLHPLRRRGEEARLATLPEDESARSFQPTFAPDGSRIAVYDGSALQISETLEGTPIVSLPLSETPRSMRFSSDGERLVVTTRERTVAYRLGDARPLLTLPSGSSADIAPNGTIAAHCREGRLHVVDAIAGTEIVIGRCTRASEITLSHTGEFVAVESAAVVRVHRSDGSGSLTLRSLRAPERSLLLAYDEAGRFELSGEPEGLVRYREEGPIYSADLADVEGHRMHRPGLVRDFFARAAAP